MIPHSECSIDEEMEFITSTQYVISGYTLIISRVKGGVQVRVRVEFSIVIFRESTAKSRPIDVGVVGANQYML